MHYFERFPLIRGIFRTRTYRQGILVEKYEDHNLIVNEPRIRLAHLLAGEEDCVTIGAVAFGTNGDYPDRTDTLITNQFVKTLSGHSFPDVGHIQFDWELRAPENNGMAILEFGLVTADGQLFARKTRTNPIYKESDISIEGQWTIIF
jgi:hypothetical protein